MISRSRALTSCFASSSFSDAAAPEHTEPLVDFFVEQLRRAGFTVATGVFGAHMDVEIHNDGPVTLLVEK